MIKNYIGINLLIFITIFSSACTNKNQELIIDENEPIVQEAPIIVEEEEIEEVIAEPEPELTPLEMCDVEEDKSNLIVSAPNDSKIRILNIFPNYKDCIALKNGKYRIEVTKKGYMKYDEWIELNESVQLDIAMIEVLKLNIKKKKKRTKKVQMIKYSGCKGYYPKNILDNILEKNTPFYKWDNIRWAGSCGQNKLMKGRGTLSFEVRKGLQLKLKGTMKDGFFNGSVYYSSSDDYVGQQITVQLETKEDYKNYQK